MSCSGSSRSISFARDVVSCDIRPECREKADRIVDWNNEQIGSSTARANRPKYEAAVFFESV